MLLNLPNSFHLKIGTVLYMAQTSSLFRITEHLEELSVYERSTDSFKFDNPNVEIKHCTVTGVRYEHKLIYTRGSVY